MSGIQLNSITGPESPAATAVAAALAPRAKAQVTNSTGDATSGSNTGATTGAATITSSDFLTLLVTELKNQDPTQPTDPNAYIQQLVGVNSLQQLISINQDLTPPAASTSTTGT